MLSSVIVTPICLKTHTYQLCATKVTTSRINVMTIV